MLEQRLLCATSLDRREGTGQRTPDQALMAIPNLMERLKLEMASEKRLIELMAEWIELAEAGKSRKAKQVLGQIEDIWKKLQALRGRTEV